MKMFLFGRFGIVQQAIKRIPGNGSSLIRQGTGKMNGLHKDPVDFGINFSNCSVNINFDFCRLSK
jgi:hypothetical protein